MEKIPGFRVVGGASEEVKEKTKQEIELRLTDHIKSLSEADQKEIKRLEYPKTEEEYSLINFANAETNRLREESGMEPYTIPAENYHIVPPELFKKVTNSGSSAMASSMDQASVYNANQFRDNPVRFGAATLHETLHLKGHYAVEVEETEKEGKKVERRTQYREGISALAAQKKKDEEGYHSHFDGLHEAIVSEQEKRSFPNLLALPILKKEKEKLSSAEARKLAENISKREGIPVEEIYWVGERENEYNNFGYGTQRKVLNYVCEEIQRQFPKRYQSPEEVFKEFLKAQFTGQLLPIARLVEDTFGEGSFRMLGNMKNDKESGILALEILRKARIRTKK
jgi:hypothetical protein